MNNSVVMLIEADVLVRTPLAEYLRECGFRVAEAFNVAEAREILAKAPVSVDMILMDADAPEESGFVFRAWVRVNYPAIEVILAGSIERTVKKAGELCEEGPALSKPYDHKFVLDEIRRRSAARDRNAGEPA
jgi:DNA-binding NtrC family response regulator